jgi:hypothetical protein
VLLIPHIQYKTTIGKVLLVRNLRVTLMLAAFLSAAAGLAACGTTGNGNYVATPDVSAVQQTPLGRALASNGNGYTPVSAVYNQRNVMISAVYKYCGGDTNITHCAKYVTASAEHPILYTIGNQVVVLQGDHLTGFLDGRSYLMDVPTNWRNFARLTPAQQHSLLGCMVEAQRDDKGQVGSYILLTALGSAETHVYLQQTSTTGSSY